MLLLRRHILDEHQRGAGEQDESVTELLTQAMGSIVDEDVLTTYKRHIYAIARRRARLDSRRWLYNFPLPDDQIEASSLMSMIRYICLRVHSRSHKQKDDR